MRILQIVADGSPGGGTTIVLGLVEECLKAGMETHLLIQAGSYGAERGTMLGATVHHADFFAGRINREAEGQIRAIADRVAPDVIHVHGGRAGFFVRRGLPAPIAYTVHGYHFLRKPVLKRTLGLLAERRAGRAATEMVFVCRYDLEICRRFSLAPESTPKQVIYNGIRLADLGQPRESEPKRIAFVGRLTEQKDPLLAIEVAKELASDGYRLEMIGGGELEDEVRRKIAGSGVSGIVSVTGAVKREDALARLAKAEIMLMTSRWEGLPVAILEAMALGVPVVAARNSGIPEIIVDGESGRLVGTRSPADFAEAVRWSHANRERVISAARRTVDERFLWEQCASKHLELYRRLTEHRLGTR